MKRYTVTHYEKVGVNDRWPAHDIIEVFDFHYKSYYVAACMATEAIKGTVFRVNRK